MSFVPLGWQRGPASRAVLGMDLVQSTSGCGEWVWAGIALRCHARVRLLSTKPAADALSLPYPPRTPPVSPALPQTHLRLSSGWFCSWQSHPRVPG